MIYYSIFIFSVSIIAGIVTTHVLWLLLFIMHLECLKKEKRLVLCLWFLGLSIASVHHLEHHRKSYELRVGPSGSFLRLSSLWWPWIKVDSGANKQLIDGYYVVNGYLKFSSTSRFLPIGFFYLDDLQIDFNHSLIVDYSQSLFGRLGPMTKKFIKCFFWQQTPYEEDWILLTIELGSIHLLCLSSTHLSMLKIFTARQNYMYHLLCLILLIATNCPFPFLRAIIFQYLSKNNHEEAFYGSFVITMIILPQAITQYSFWLTFYYALYLDWKGFSEQRLKFFGHGWKLHFSENNTIGPAHVLAVWSDLFIKWVMIPIGFIVVPIGSVFTPQCLEQFLIHLSYSINYVVAWIMPGLRMFTVHKGFSLLLIVGLFMAETRYKKEKIPLKLKNRVKKL